MCLDEIEASLFLVLFLLDPFLMGIVMIHSREICMDLITSLFTLISSFDFAGKRVEDETSLKLLLLLCFFFTFLPSKQ